MVEKKKVNGKMIKLYKYYYSFNIYYNCHRLNKDQLKLFKYNLIMGYFKLI